jgi:hypothetical protein
MTCLCSILLIVTKTEDLMTRAVMGHPTPPKQMAQRLARVLRPERPEYAYLTKVFRHTRTLLAVKPAARGKRLPHLLTDRELVAFYEAVWQARCHLQKSSSIFRSRVQ